MSAFEMAKKAVSLKMEKFTKSDIMELCPEIARASVVKYIYNVLTHYLLCQ